MIVLNSESVQEQPKAMLYRNTRRDSGEKKIVTKVSESEIKK